MGRQGANYHKCHRCIYRGKAADWTPPLAADPLPAIELLPALVVEDARPVASRAKPAKAARKPVGREPETVAAMAAVKRERKTAGKPASAAIDATL